MTRRRVVIVGAGGQARDCRYLLERATDPEGHRYESVGFVVSDLARLGPTDDAEHVVGDMDWLAAHQGELDGLVMGIGTPGVRLRVAEELEQRFPTLAWPTLIDPSALFDRASASLGRGVQICAGVVGTVNLTLADHVLLNPGVSLGHEARLGRACVMNHAAGVSGGVVVGDATLIGTGARVLQYLRVGASATVGAGAVVTRDVDDGTTVVGIPARPMSRQTR